MGPFVAVGLVHWIGWESCALRFLNMQKEAMMMRCIEDLQAQSDIALQKMVGTPLPPVLLCALRHSHSRRLAV